LFNRRWSDWQQANNRQSKGETMSKHKHTPGPWYYGKYADRVTKTKNSDGSDSICHVYTGNQAANARLIAAAPEMLELLMSCRAFASYEGHIDLMNRIDKLIERIEGEQ
jgi:hypothetical protein